MKSEKIRNAAIYILIAIALFIQVRGLIYATSMFAHIETALVFLGAAAIIIFDKSIDRL